MNTTQLECFLAVAETLNFARAAEHLHVTQPAVTHQINSLESELDVKLFRRSTRSVELTAEGMRFFADARTILSMVAGARARLTHHSKEQVQEFHIGCHGALELSLLPPVLKELLEEFPTLHPRLHVVPFQSLQNLLQEEVVDVILGFKGRDETSSFLYRELLAVRLACVLPPEHPLTRFPRLQKKQLETGNMIVSAPHKAPPPIARLQGQLIGAQALPNLYFCENMEAALALVKAGIGFAILPDIPPARDPDLVYIPIEGTETLSFGMAYKRAKNNPFLKSFQKRIIDFTNSISPEKER